MEKKLYEWFELQRSKNCPISGEILKVKAKAIFTEMYPEKADDAFVASNGWYDNFKRRYGIRVLGIAVEEIVRRFISNYTIYSSSSSKDA